MRVFVFFLLGIAASVSITSFASADDIVIPYACEIDAGAPKLSPSEANIYHIYGQRQDLPFTSCGPSPSGACETMMVHKFVIDCGGQHIAWWKVANAATSLGVELPQDLPPGFAPISRLGGRFVLPGFAPKPPLDTRVAMQQLSPDSVIETGSVTPRTEFAPWVTVVDSNGKASVASHAYKVAVVLFALVASLMAACLIVARRRPALHFEFGSVVRGASTLNDQGKAFFKLAIDAVVAAFRHSYESWRAAADAEGGDANLVHALTAIHARLSEAELLVATLPSDLLLRDVLTSEIETLRERAAEVAKRISRLGPERATSLLRSFHRDLDRITRIVHGTAKPEAESQSEYRSEARGEYRAPSSAHEAYRVLGLNPEAPDVAVKKIVDALRMSWHPDRALNEADRRYREQRIKQINAAWDILKVRRAAAA